MGADKSIHFPAHERVGKRREAGQERWVYMGFRESSGERIGGWLVRALNNDVSLALRIIPKLGRIGAYPDKLKGLLTAAEPVPN